MQRNSKQYLKKLFWSKISNKLVAGRPRRGPAVRLWGWLLVTILTFISLLSVKYLLKPGFHYGHDSLWHVQRITAMYQELKKGHFPVRWVSSLDNKYGVPLFNYVYPGPYYLAAGLMFLGLGNVAAFNLTTAFFYVLGGLGMYFLFRRKPFVGFVSALIYLFTPYQFVNLFVRGAFGEIAVMGLAPWVFVALEDFKVKQQLKWYHPIPLALALISHNFLGPILFALTFIYLLIIKLPVTGHPRRGLEVRLCGWSLVVSLALASFFLLPMFFERSYLLSSVERNFSFKYSDHFVYPQQLFYSKWDYWYSMPGIAKDGMTFQLGFANIIIFLTTILMLLLSKRLTVNGEQLTKLKFFLLSFFFFLFLTLPYSAFIWRSLPLMQAMQFPWRFLAFTTLISAILSGLVLEIIAQRSKTLTFIIGIGLVFLAIFNTRHYHRSMRTLSQKEFQTYQQIYADKTTTSARSELIPKWAPKERWQPIDPGLVGLRLAKYDGGSRVDKIKDREDNIYFTAFAENDRVKLRLYRNYFPSWHATIDGQKLALSPSESGEIIIPLQSGKHSYHLWVGQTNLEKLANLISLITFLYILYLSFMSRFFNKRGRSFTK